MKDRDELHGNVLLCGFGVGYSWGPQYYTLVKNSKIYNYYKFSLTNDFSHNPSMNQGVILYGAGGHCKVVMDIVGANGLEIAKIHDDNPKHDEFMDVPCSFPSGVYDKAIITIGNCQIRKKITEKIKVKEFIRAIHPFTCISKNSTIGEGTVIMQGAIVQAGTSIGKHCNINTKASVDHDCKLSDFVHIAPGATICGEVEIGECTWIGAGAVVKQCIKIGRNCIIGAGAVIIRDIPDNSVAVGNPGHIIKILNHI